MTKVVIVESPAKAKTINKFLGNEYVVLASFGHVRDLPSKDGSVLVEQNFDMLYENLSKSKSHLDKIIDAVKKASEVLLATDPDREGEAIAWHVVEVLKGKKVLKKDHIVKRIVFTEITKKAVLSAVANPRDIDINLVEAQQARRALDYLVGFNISPILWRKLPGSKSAGRVQSVALRLIAERDDEIENFVKREYWDISVDFLTQNKQLLPSVLTHVSEKKLEKFSLKTEQDASEIAKDLAKKDFSVEDILKKDHFRRAAPPFITSTIQQEASRKLGFTTKKTMKVAQELYEGINVSGEVNGLITYMRTDGLYLADEAIKSIRAHIGKNYGDKYLPQNPIIYKTKNANAQEAHEAIRPTNIDILPQQIESYLTSDQYRLYELIWKRTIACQMENSKSEITTVNIISNDKIYRLKAVGSVIIFDGFLKIYQEGLDDAQDEGNKIIPKVAKDEVLATDKITPRQHFTEPPARFSEASLVKKLEELGIGRPSTYSTIISVLQEREYVILEKKRFFCADRGRVVAAFLKNFFEKYVEYDFTASLENKLDDVSSGKVTRANLLTEFWGDFTANISNVKDQTPQNILEVLNQDLAKHFFSDSEGNINCKCPQCGDDKLAIRSGRFGVFIACGNYPECTYKRQVAEGTGNGEGQPEEEKFFIELGSEEKIYLKKGPYGFYLQKDEDGKAKRIAVPKEINVENLDAYQASKLIALPLMIGNHPETGKEITLGIGRYGPYILYEGQFSSVKTIEQIFNMDLNQAVEFLSSSKKGGSTSEPLGKHPSLKEDILVLSGKYGPYLKVGKKNVPIPKNEPSDIDLLRAIEIIDGYKK
jgi:DNA topoisomerase-1